MGSLLDLASSASLETSRKRSLLMYLFGICLGASWAHAVTKPGNTNNHWDTKVGSTRAPMFKQLSNGPNQDGFSMKHVENDGGEKRGIRGVMSF